MAKIANSTVTGIRSFNSPMTGALNQGESPKSPCTTPLIQVTYWTTIGLSVPISWRSLAKSSWVKEPTPSSSRMANAGSPGIQRISTKTKTVTKSTVGTNRPTLFIVCCRIYALRMLRRSNPPILGARIQVYNPKKSHAFWRFSLTAQPAHASGGQIHKILSGPYLVPF